MLKNKDDLTEKLKLNDESIQVMTIRLSETEANFEKTRKENDLQLEKAKSEIEAKKQEYKNQEISLKDL